MVGAASALNVAWPDDGSRLGVWNHLLATVFRNKQGRFHTPTAGPNATCTCLMLMNSHTNLPQSAESLFGNIVSRKPLLASVLACCGTKPTCALGCDSVLETSCELASSVPQDGIRATFSCMFCNLHHVRAGLGETSPPKHQPVGMYTPLEIFLGPHEHAEALSVADSLTATGKKAQ